MRLHKYVYSMSEQIKDKKHITNLAVAVSGDTDTISLVQNKLTLISLISKEVGINVEGVQKLQNQKWGGWNIAARVLSFSIQIAKILGKTSCFYSTAVTLTVFV